MLVVNTDFVPGKEITEVFGIVKGSTIQAKHFGKDILAGFRHIVGGEVKEYTAVKLEIRV
ncbi:MAG: heavy metal-binding domain-containing protein [Methanophagales archaeon]|nr:heavy metal-binding domain-containing protein [Methanophagales archaeon]